MTATDSRGRTDKRPPWLQQKHSQQSADPKLARWADSIIAILAADPEHAYPGFAPDEATARRRKNELYAALKRWNFAHPDQQLSLSANVVNPSTGKCEARGVERCSQNGCEPTPGRHGFHARVHTKAAGRAHQGAKPRETWDYDPLVGRKRSPASHDDGYFGEGQDNGAAEPESKDERKAAEAEPGHLKPGAKVRSAVRAARPAPAATSRRSARSPKSSPAPQPDGEPESVVKKLRRGVLG